MEAENQTAPVEEAAPNEASAAGRRETADAPGEAAEGVPNEANPGEAVVDQPVADGSEPLPNEASSTEDAASQPSSGGETPAPNEANSLSADELLPFEPAPASNDAEDGRLKAVIEAIIYVTDEPLGLDQISAALEQPRDRIAGLLEQLAAEYERPERGLSIREVAGGYKLSTKAEHHDAVRRFVKNLKPALKLSLPALETLAVIAYKQPITAPEIMEIRGVQGAGVLKTLLDRKVIATAGRKNVVGKPILYKTTREFLVQFGLKDLAELPTLKEFQEIGRMDMEGSAAAAPPKAPVERAGEELPREEQPGEEPRQDPAPPEPPVEEPPREPDQPASQQASSEPAASDPDGPGQVQ